MARDKKGEVQVKVPKLPFLRPEYLKLILVGALGIILIVAGKLMSNSGKDKVSEGNALMEAERVSRSAGKGSGKGSFGY